MILVLMNANPKPRAALFYPARRFAAVCLDQASNIADVLAFGNDSRLSENPGGQLRNCRHSLSELSTTWFSVPGEYNKREREESLPQRGVGGIVKGNSVTYTLSDGKKIQKVTDVVTGTGVSGAGVEFSAPVEGPVMILLSFVEDIDRSLAEINSQPTPLHELSSQKSLAIVQRDRFKHCFSQEVVSRLDIDRYNATFVLPFELRFQLFPIDRFRFPVEGQWMTVLHVNSVYLVQYHFGSLTRRPAAGRGKVGATRRSRTGDLLITNQLLYQLS